MSLTLYSTAGCMRCKAVKAFMKDKGLEYREVDFKSDGKNEFNKFYRANREHIHRGEEGVEFPLISDGEVVRQGVGVIVAWLLAGSGLEGFVGRSDLSHGWIGGLDVSGGDPSHAEDFLEVLRHLHTHGLKIQLRADGRNSGLLEQTCAEGLADRVIVEAGAPSEGLARTAAAAAKAPEYKFVFMVAPVRQSDGTLAYPEPATLAETAEEIEKATGTKSHPTFIRLVQPQPDQEIEPLASSAGFKYRTPIRRFLVKAEIEK